MNIKTKLRGLREIWNFDNRLWLLTSRLFFPKEKLHVYRIGSIEFLNDQAGGDANGARELFTTTMYSRFLPVMRLAGPVNVLDLGANNGGFPLMLMHHGLELGKVVCVELNPRTYTRLQFNLLRNMEGAVPLNVAVCGNDGMLEVELGPGSVSDSIYGSRPLSPSSRHRIAGLSFDTLYDRHFGDQTVDICKIDVEGAEFEVFDQPHHQRIRNCRYLIMEIHDRPDSDPISLIRHLEELDFSHQPPVSDSGPSVHFFVNKQFEE